MEEEGGDHAPGHACDHVAHLEPHVQKPRGAAAVTHHWSLKLSQNVKKKCSVYSVSLGEQCQALYFIIDRFAQSCFFQISILFRV